jgi:hypothetical protein
MNSNFKQLLDQFSEQWESVVQSSNLQEVESRFSDVEETRDDILNWVFDNIQNEEEQGSYFNTFGEVESNLAETLGDIHVFDDEFDIYESFDEYESYYQRYGCIVPEFVISWDDQRILWSDELQFIDYIQRPDVLMGGND